MTFYNDPMFTKVKQPSDIPNGPHYVIMIFDSYTPYSGYEADGHISSPEVLPIIYISKDKDSWIEKIKEIESSNNNPPSKYSNGTVYSAYHVAGVAKVETSITVSTEIIS